MLKTYLFNIDEYLNQRCHLITVSYIVLLRNASMSIKATSLTRTDPTSPGLRGDEGLYVLRIRIASLWHVDTVHRSLCFSWLLPTSSYPPESDDNVSPLDLSVQKSNAAARWSAKTVERRVFFQWKGCFHESWSIWHDAGKQLFLRGVHKAKCMTRTVLKQVLLM